MRGLATIGALLALVACDAATAPKVEAKGVAAAAADDPGRLLVSRRDGVMKALQVRFDEGGSTLSAHAEVPLQAIAAALLETVSASPGTRARIVGHADATIGAEAALALSLLRARAVASWLAEHGVDPAIIKPVGVGGDEPLTDSTTRSGRAQNDRVDVRLVTPPR